MTMLNKQVKHVSGDKRYIKAYNYCKILMF